MRKIFIFEINKLHGPDRFGKIPVKSVFSGMSPATPGFRRPLEVYESGAARIGSHRLGAVAEVLELPLVHFLPKDLVRELTDGFGPPPIC